MKNYIVVIELTKEAQEKHGYAGAYGTEWKREHIKRNIAEPFNQKKPFWFLGRQLNPNEIFRICIFPYKGEPKQIILPNGKRLDDQNDFSYILDCLTTINVPNVYEDVSGNFLNPVAESSTSTRLSPMPSVVKNKIFIVHGRDEAPALALQKHLTRDLGLDAEMFEDAKKRFASKTIIELLEYVTSTAAYAFVVVTPDDLGYLCKDIEKCEKELLIAKTKVKAEEVRKLVAKFNKRARQNVVFELGLFYGILRRDRVCCLLQVDVQEKPSDIDGVLYVPFEKSVEEKFAEIREKLKEAKLLKNSTS